MASQKENQKEKLVAEALKLVEKGQHERAVKLYLKVVAEDEKDVRIWLKIGDLYTKLRRNHEAAETYDRVAQVYSEQGFYTKAIAVYKQILKLDPGMVATYERLADLYRQMGLIPDAIEQYTAVATHYQGQGDIRAALSALKQIVELDPQNVSSRVKLAEMYSKEQMGREAIDEFAKAAEYLHEQGRLDDYMKVAERLLFHSPDNRPVSRELARLYLQKGDARRALPRLQVCFKADPRDAETLSLLADAFHALGQKVKAVSVLKELARVHAENGSREQRDSAWRRILKLDPADPEATSALTESRVTMPKRDQTSPQVPSARGPLSAVSSLSPSPSPIGREPLAFSHASPIPLAPPTMPNAPAMAMAAGPSASSSPTHGERRGTLGAVAAVAPSLSSAQSPGTYSGRRGTLGAVPAVAAAAPTSQPPAASGPISDEEIRKILLETDVYMKYTLHAKAIEHVRTVFDRAPDHVGAREKLKTLFVALGRTAEAVEELKILVENAADSPRQSDYLQEILALSPGDAWAASKLSAAHHTPRFAPPPPILNGRSGPPQPPPPTRSSVSAPLPVDLPIELDMDSVEELSAGDVEIDDIEVTEDPSMAQIAAPPSAPADDPFGDLEDEQFPLVVASPQAPPAPPVLEEIEDRFGADLDGSDGTHESPPAASLPPQADAFDGFAGLDDEVGGDETTFGPPPSAPVPSAEPDVENFDFSSFDDPTPAPQPVPVRSADGPRLHLAPAAPPRVEAAPELRAEDSSVAILPAASDGASPRAGLEDELDEADFYIQQGMVDEARDLLYGLLSRHPGHAFVITRLRDLEGDAQSDATQAVSLDEIRARDAASHAPDPESVFDPGDLDGAFSESNETIGTNGTSVTVEPTSITSGGARKNVVEMGVNEDDFESHFDLGIAYKEMGLLDDAINEFKLVMRDPAREVQCHMMVGLCFVAKGKNTDAISHFKQGLYAEGIGEDEELSLYYELAGAYERLGDTAEARYYYDRIAKRKPRYRDVERRLGSLSGEATAEDYAPGLARRK